MNILIRIVLLLLRLFFGEEQSGEPKYIRYLLYPVLSEDERESFIGDLIEDYKKLYLEADKIEADKWLCKEVFTSLWPLIKRPTIFINLISRWNNLRPTHRPQLAYITALTILLFLIFTIFWLAQTKPDQLSVAQITPIKPSPERNSIDTLSGYNSASHISDNLEISEPAEAHSLPMKRSPAKNARTRSTPSLASTLIVLESNSVLRDMEQDVNQREVVVKAGISRIRLKIMLPERSTTGIYDVSVVDAFNNPLMVKKAESRDGKIVIATFEMQRLPAKKYFVSVSHEGEAPSLYPLTVVKK